MDSFCAKVGDIAFNAIRHPQSMTIKIQHIDILMHYNISIKEIYAISRKKQEKVVSVDILLPAKYEGRKSQLFQQPKQRRTGKRKIHHSIRNTLNSIWFNFYKVCIMKIFCLDISLD